MTTLRRRLIDTMERFGFYGTLAKVGTSRARAATQDDVELFHDGIWIRRVGDRFYGDKARFDYYADEFQVWNFLHKLWAGDPEDLWLYDYEPKPGDVVVDIGAGFGNDAILFSRAVGPTGVVVAVEAHPVSYRRLVKTCKWSKLHNVIPVDIAVDSRRTTKWISGEDDDRGNSVGGIASDEGVFEVPAEPFDDIASLLKLERLSFLKMNIEGAETDALAGMTETLKKTERVAISCHDFRTEQGESEFFRTRKKVSQILRDAGFHLKRRVNDPRPYVADTLYGVREKAA